MKKLESLSLSLSLSLTHTHTHTHTYTHTHTPPIKFSMNQIHFKIIKDLSHFPSAPYQTYGRVNM